MLSLFIRKYLGELLRILVFLEGMCRLNSCFVLFNLASLTPEAATLGTHGSSERNILLFHGLFNFPIHKFKQLLHANLAVVATSETFIYKQRIPLLFLIFLRRQLRTYFLDRSWNFRARVDLCLEDPVELKFAFGYVEQSP